MTAITRALAEFVAGLSDERLPRPVPERAKLLVFDSVGIALRARHEGGSTPSLVAAAQKLGLTGGTATVIGDVEIGAETNIWFGCLVRGDMNIIRIGKRVNIQDLTVVHVDSQKYGTFIGDDVTIGHSAVIHACTLQDRCFVGMQACVMDGAVVETGAMVAAGALVPPGKTVKAGQLWAGTPARCPCSSTRCSGSVGTSTR